MTDCHPTLSRNLKPIHHSHTDAVVAVLVDGENIPGHCLEKIMHFAGLFGQSNIRRYFENFARNGVPAWRDSPYAAHAFTPIHVPTTSPGKNASDIALAIAAMDIAYLRLANVICIASSDGDFTMLAHRLRELGVRVVGFGSPKSPKAWVAACERFELVYGPSDSAPAASVEEEAFTHNAAIGLRNVKRDGISISDIVDAWLGFDSDRSLSSLGQTLRDQIPGFDPRDYGFPQIRKLVESLSGYEITPGPKGKRNDFRVRRCAVTPIQSPIESSPLATQ